MSGLRPRVPLDVGELEARAKRAMSAEAFAYVKAAVVEAVGGRVPVLLDSGIRGGADAFKALALGATAVLLGRPYDGAGGLPLDRRDRPGEPGRAG